MEPTMSRAIDFTHAASKPTHTDVWQKFRAAFARMMRDRIEEWMVRRTINSLHALDDRTLKESASREAKSSRAPDGGGRSNLHIGHTS